MAGFSVWRRPGCWATSLVPLSLVLTMTPSSADEFWTGAVSTDWFNAGNWTAGVPTNTDSTRIDTATPNATMVGAAGGRLVARAWAVAGRLRVPSYAAISIRETMS